MTVIGRDASAGGAIVVVRAPVPSGSELSCDATDTAVFVRDGRVLGALGPGRHALGPGGAPFLSLALSPDGSLAASVYLVRTAAIRGLRFGGPLPSLQDAQTGLALSPRVLGEAAVRIADPSRAVAALASAPDQDPSAMLASYVGYAVVEASKAVLAAEAGRGLARSVTDPGAAASLGSVVADGARAQLSPMGIELLEVSSFALSLSEEDMARLRAALGVAAPSADAVYQMLWDCKFCGQKKLLGLTHRHCPSCGAPQNAEERYFPSDAEKVRAEDHEYAGADVVCAHCQEANGRKAKHCGGCGAPLEAGKEIGRRQDQVLAAGEEFAGQTRGDARRERSPAAAAAPRAPKKSGVLRTLAGIGCATVLVVIGLVVVGLLWKKEGVLEVTAHSWRREITIEAFGPVSDSSWCDNVPFEARGVRRSREVRSHRRVEDGEDCHVRKVDRGNGTFVEKQECSPRFRDDPVYDEKCYYTVNRWRPSRKVDASGASVSDAPRWPALQLLRTGTCEGCEREGARKETYTVELTDPKSGKQTCELAAPRWAELRDGSKWKGEIRVIGHTLDCATLRAD